MGMASTPRGPMHVPGPSERPWARVSTAARRHYVDYFRKYY